MLVAKTWKVRKCKIQP